MYCDILVCYNNIIMNLLCIVTGTMDDILSTVDDTTFGKH